MTVNLVESLSMVDVSEMCQNKFWLVLSWLVCLQPSSVRLVPNSLLVGHKKGTHPWSVFEIISWRSTILVALWLTLSLEICNTSWELLMVDSCGNTSFIGRISMRSGVISFEPNRFSNKRKKSMIFISVTEKRVSGVWFVSRKICIRRHDETTFQIWYRLTAAYSTSSSTSQYHQSVSKIKFISRATLDLLGIHLLCGVVSRRYTKKKEENKTDWDSMRIVRMSGLVFQGFLNLCFSWSSSDVSLGLLRCFWVDVWLAAFSLPLMVWMQKLGSKLYAACREKGPYDFY